MIRIDYSLKQIGLDRTYYSNSEHEKINSESALFMVEGENGKGKSFLLYLLTFALKAHLNVANPIDSNIRSKIAELGNRNKFELKYNIEIFLPDSRYSIICTKEINEDGKIFRREIKSNTQTVINEKVAGDYVEVIFDVPNNIEARLGKVKDDIIEEIINYKDHFQSLTENFATNLYEINKVRDIDIINKSEELIHNFKDEIERKKNKINELETSKTFMQSYKKLNELLFLYKNESNDSDEFSKLKAKLKNKKQPVTRVANKKKIDALEQNIDEYYKIVKAYQNDINILLISSKNSLLTQQLIMKYEDDYNILFQFGIDKLIRASDLASSCNTLQRNIPSIAKTLIDNDKIELLKTLNNLIEIFESNASNINSKLGELIGDISRIHDALITERDSINVVDYNEIGQGIIHKLKEIQKACKEILILEKSLEKERRSHILTPEDEKIEKEFNRMRMLNDNIKNYPSKIAILKAEIGILSVVEEKWCQDVNNCENYIRSKATTSDVKNYKQLPNYGIDILRKEIKEIEDSITTIEGKIKSHQAMIDNELEKPIGKIPEDIMKLLSKTRDTMIETYQQLNEYVGYINGTNSESDISTEKAKIIENFIGSLIAESLNNVLPLDNKTHEITSYNYKHQYFQTKEGNHLYMDYVSTGLSSASYLMHKIRSRSKPYQLILLDEVGNMSANSRKLVLAEVSELYREKSLINLLMAKVRNDVDLQINQIN